MVEVRELSPAQREVVSALAERHYAVGLEVGEDGVLVATVQRERELPPGADGADGADLESDPLYPPLRYDEDGRALPVASDWNVRL